MRNIGHGTEESGELDGFSLLVSNSSEVGGQMDSMRLDYTTLAEMAEGNMFKGLLDASGYLTQNHFNAYMDILNERCMALEGDKASLPTSQQDMAATTPKLRVVDGQVILVEADSIPDGYSPEQYVETVWDVRPRYRLFPIDDCMLRGILDSIRSVGQSVQPVPRLQGNQTVTLTPDNMPSHAHHCGVATGAGFATVSPDPSARTYTVDGNVACCVFRNDSMDIGVDAQGNGCVDGIHINQTGRNDGAQSGAPCMSHPNMPAYHAFLGFVARKVTD